MHDFYTSGSGRFDAPVSTVKPQRTRSEVLRALDEFELLALSSQDEGFLRLAKEVFSEPVLVAMDKDGILSKPGFITSGDLENLGLEGKVAVYFPHSYNFSGNLFIVDRKMVSKIEGNNTDVMKYIVSGGVSGKMGKITN